jgi:photosystem II stability/assembly factor-like uncharacterized protein
MSLMFTRRLGAEQRSRVLPLCALFAGLTWLGQACTFYTAPPPEQTGGTGGTDPTGSGGSSGGKSGSNGGSSGSSSGSSGSAGDGTEAGAGGEGNAGPVLVWTERAGDLSGRTMPGPVSYLSIKPGEDKLIAGVQSYGLFGSTDGGETWEGLGLTGDSDPITHRISAIIYDPENSDTFWEIGYYGVNVGGGGLYRTDDGGETLNIVGDVFHIDLVGIDFTDPERKLMIAGKHETPQLVYRSTDSGATWDDTLGPNITPDCAHSSFPVVFDPATYLLGCTNMILKTTNGGMDWEVVSRTGGNDRPLIASDGGIYWLAKDGLGLMRSDDEGDNWLRVVGTQLLTRPPIELPDGRLAAPGLTHLQISENRGEAWSAVGPELPYPPLGVLYSEPQKAFYIWADKMDGDEIPPDGIVRFDWDYEVE